MPHVEFELPIRTSTLGNAKGHWRTRHRVAVEQRNATSVFAARHVRGIPATASSVRVTFTRLSSGRLDKGNAYGAMKHIEDALSKLIGIDDGDSRWDLVVEQAKAPRGTNSLHVRVDWTP